MSDGGQAAELRPYRDLRERDLRLEGLFIGEGRLVVERLLASGWPVLSVLCTPAQAAHFRLLAAGRCPVLVKSEADLAELAGFPFHRGVIAAARRPALPELSSFLESSGADAAELTLVVCPRLTGSANLGSIARSAAAFGAHALAIGERCCDPLSRQAIKASAGALLRLPLVRLGDEPQALALLARLGFQVAGTAGWPSRADSLPGGRARRLPDYRRPPRLAVVFGNEAAGLEEPWLGGCDRLLSVPMPGGVDSLNVAVAAGILLWELGARRRVGPVPPEGDGASAAEQN